MNYKDILPNRETRLKILNACPLPDKMMLKIMFRMKPHTHQRCSEGSNKTLYAPRPRDPTETESDLCLSLLRRDETAVACHRGRGLGAAT